MVNETNEYKPNTTKISSASHKDIPDKDFKNWVLQDIEEIRHLVIENNHFIKDIKPKITDFFHQFYKLKSLFTNLQWFVVFIIGVVSLYNSNSSPNIDMKQFIKLIQQQNTSNTDKNTSK